MIKNNMCHHTVQYVYSLWLFQIQNASDDLSPFEYVRDSAIRAVRDREANLSAPIYLLSAVVNRLGRRRVNPRVTEVYSCNYCRMFIVITITLYTILQLLLTVGSSLLDIPQTDRESRLESLEVGSLYVQKTNMHVCINDTAHDQYTLYAWAAKQSSYIIFTVDSL